MLTLFNNCRGRDHVVHYGEGAFFDLDPDDAHMHRVAELTAGSECVVASYGDRGTVIFNWYSFAREELIPDEHGFQTHVFFGALLRSEVVTKPAAAAAMPYAVLFTRNGHFKRVPLKQVD